MSQATEKASAKRFLQSLEAHVQHSLPTPEAMLANVASILRENRRPGGQGHLKSPEAAVFNHYILPSVASFLAGRIGVAAARRALLAESSKHFPEVTSGSPARRIRHPFTKVIGRKPATIIAQWKAAQGGSSLVQSCPDFAFRRPAPFTVVFEGKYFPPGGGLQQAESALATGIYEAFFYRGLPRVVEPPSSTRPHWDYEYACLVICDASKDGIVMKAWNHLPEQVRDGCWEGANLYVMVLRNRDETSPKTGETAGS